MAGLAPESDASPKNEAYALIDLCYFSTHRRRTLTFESHSPPVPTLRTDVLPEHQDQACCMRLTSVQRRSYGLVVLNHITPM